MVVPALIYLGVNLAGAAARRTAGRSPTATDIAFALAALAAGRAAACRSRCGSSC